MVTAIFQSLCFPALTTFQLTGDGIGVQNQACKSSPDCHLVQSHNLPCIFKLTGLKEEKKSETGCAEYVCGVVE
ncbi:MAG TPA: hypothetical protein PK075_01110 [Chitinophagales bacterium]|nr:hypothetical protein [Chitinophagales bacterium]